MAASNTEKPMPIGGPLTTETFAPLAAASRGAPTGRVRSLDEARCALRVPNSAESEVLQLWGTPTDFQLVVYPISEPKQPDLVAEFALLRVVKRNGSELVAGDKRTRLRLREKSNALWVVYGSIAIATDGSLVIESIAIGPAFEGQLSRKGNDIAHGITGQLLRLLSPPQILAACAEQLLRQQYWLEETARRRGIESPLSTQQRELLERVDQGRPRHGRINDDQLAELAARYLTLCQRGNKSPRAQLAGEFGLTTTQVRDRLHQARQRRYLTPGTQGRAGAHPGPRLLKRGWTPARPHPSPSSKLATARRAGRARDKPKTA